MNSGAMKFEPDIEVEPSIFNTSNSRLWEKLRINFPTQILAQWEALRLTFFTEENHKLKFLPPRTDFFTRHESQFATETEE